MGPSVAVWRTDIEEHTMYLLSGEEKNLLSMIQEIKTRTSTTSGCPENDYLPGGSHFGTK